MLLQREDLRSRLIRLIGQGRISATTRVMEDAGGRVSRYLLMQLVINVSYGLAVALGLYFIGLPNAILWGALQLCCASFPTLALGLRPQFPLSFPRDFARLDDAAAHHRTFCFRSS